MLGIGCSRTTPTSARRLWGHVAIGPSGVRDQSVARTRAAISPAAPGKASAGSLREAVSVLIAHPRRVPPARYTSTAGTVRTRDHDNPANALTHLTGPDAKRHPAPPD